MTSIGPVNFDLSAFKNFPALLPPTGVQSNFEDPYSRGGDVVIACSICLGLMIAMVLMRFYTKIVIKHRIGWDDYLCIPATIGAIGFAAVSISLVHQNAIGPHQWNVPVANFTDPVLRIFIVVDVIYSPGILFAKLSLLLLYLEVFRPNQRLRYAIYFGIVFVTLFYTSTFIAFCAMAIPHPGEKLINAILSKGVASLIPASVAQGAVNVASDFYIFLLPIPGVLQLQLPLKKKVGICAIFGTGIFACLASIMGLYYRTKLNRQSDVTWRLVDILIWVVVEMTVGVMCGCMPAFAGFSRQYLPLLRSLGSFFSSRAKGLSFLKLSGRSRPSSSESSKRLATKEIKMTLGTQIDGQGRFMNSTTMFARDEDWAKLGQIAHNPPGLGRKPSGTRREWHEGMAELKRQSLSSHPPKAMSRKPSQLQTHLGGLPVHDEEKGVPGQEVRVSETEKQPYSYGYF